MGKNNWFKLIIEVFLISTSIFFAKSSQAAETVYLIYGPLKFSVSVESLEIYAEEGIITSELAFYTNQFEEETLKQLHETLRKRYKIDGVSFSRLLRTPLMEDLLRYMGQIFSTHNDYNGFYAIRGALISAALHQGEEGWTVIDVMQHFPTEGIWLDTERANDLLENSKF